MSQYCIKQHELPTGEMKNVIFSTENEIYFAGYDFMGSAEWEESIDDAYQMDTDEAEQILKDLAGSDEPAEPEKIVINTNDLMASLKTFLENIGCTNIQVSPMTGKEIESIRKNAVEL